VLGEAQIGEIISAIRLYPLLFLSLIDEKGRRNAGKRGHHRRTLRCGAHLSGALVCRRSTAALA
jgi:hypothetical protein